MSISKRTWNQIEVTQKAHDAVNQHHQERTSRHDRPHTQRNATQKSCSVRFSLEPTKIRRIKARQQRLLILKHAAECSSMRPNCGGKTCARMHCQTMNKLWKHMKDCRDNACTTKHCYSSRSVLTHYHRCVDKCCLVCAPLRLLRSMETQCMPDLPSKATPVLCSTTTIDSKETNTTTHRRVVLRLFNNLEATNITPV